MRRATAALAVLAWLGVAPSPLLADANYELAVSAKQTEIKYKQSDLLDAQRDLAVLQGFLQGYDDKASNLKAARDQLIAANQQLSTIQQNNLVKLTIRMGIETYNKSTEAANLAQGAAEALISNGVRSAVGEVIFDRVGNLLDNQNKKNLGVDDDTLLRPRTVKVKAVSDAARNAYPDLKRVSQTLALSLEAVKIAAYREDGTELEDTGAILRKNIMVRDEIAAALGKLDTIGTTSEEAKVDAEGRVPAAEAEIARLTTELQTLQNELAALQAEWHAAESQERAAADMARIVSQPPRSVPSVNVTRSETESDAEYAARVQAAQAAAARAVWDADAPALLNQIAANRTQITTADAKVRADVDAYVNGADLYQFIAAYGGNDRVHPDNTASYSGAVGGANFIEQWMELVKNAQTGLSTLQADADALSVLYSDHDNLVRRLSAIYDMLISAGASLPVSEYQGALGAPGMGQGGADTISAQATEFIQQLPDALANAQAQLDTYNGATGAWGSAIVPLRTDLDDSLAAAESALSQLVSSAASWDAALSAATGAVVDFSTGSLESHLGYFQGETFIPVLRHEFSATAYKTSLLAAISTEGSAGLTAGRNLKLRYDTLVSTLPPLKDAYDAAMNRFLAAYDRSKSYAGTYNNFPVLSDLTSAASLGSTKRPVDASGVTDQAARFQSLLYTAIGNHVTNTSGGAPQTGQPVIFWRGLPAMRQISDPGMDDPAAYLPHRLLAAKGTILEQGPTWINQPPATFQSNYTAAYNELWSIDDEAYRNYDSSIRPVVFALIAELSHVYSAYTAAHPAAVISSQPASSTHSIDPGGSYSTTLSVAASGDFLSYQWYQTQWPDYSFTWEPINGATTSSYTTPALNYSMYYRVEISNPGGTVASDVAAVVINVVYPKPTFTSAATAEARVGTAFTWTFVTDPRCWIWPHAEVLPPGLRFEAESSRLVGIPTSAGTFILDVMANNQGSMEFQEFVLTVAPSLSDPSISDAPASQVARVGDALTLRVTATGTGTLRYVWKKDGTAIPGATTATFQIARVATTDAGVYTVDVTSDAGTVTTPEATVTVVTPPFITWLESHFSSSELADPTIGGTLADPDHDGLANLLEYALGSDPKSPTQTGLPLLSLSEGQWSCTYTFASDRTDITCTVEASTNLKDWSSTAIVPEYVTGDSATQTWRARYTGDVTGKIFFRLRIER